MPYKTFLHQYFNRRIPQSSACYSAHTKKKKEKLSWSRNKKENFLPNKNTFQGFYSIQSPSKKKKMLSSPH